MLRNMKAEHKKQLLFLAEQSSQVLQDFCKLATDYLQKGPNLKLYAAAAQRLEVEPEVIRASVEGLINLLLETCKNQLSEETFRETIMSLGFNDEREQLLVKLNETKRPDIERALTKIGLQLLRYHDMEWRFEIKLASRSLLNQLTPILTLDLQLKSYEKSNDIQHILLQCDTKNLLRLSEELESAMADGQTRHIRSIKRHIK